MLQPLVSGICKRRLFFCACFFNLLLASATRLAMAGFRGDTDDAMEVPPEDFLDSLEAINIRWRNYQRMLFTSKGAFIIFPHYTSNQGLWLPFLDECGVIFSSNAVTIFRGLSGSESGSTSSVISTESSSSVSAPPNSFDSDTLLCFIYKK